MKKILGYLCVFLFLPVFLGCSTAERRHSRYMEQLRRRHEENLAAQRYLAIEAQQWSERQKEARQRGYLLPSAPIPAPPVIGVPRSNMAFPQ